MDMGTEPYKLTRRCEVTAILILYGLPRLLTGSILAHEMMHAWLRLRGYRTVSQDIEGGICQVLAHMWLQSQLHHASSSSSNFASTSSTYFASTSSKQSARSPTYEKKLGGGKGEKDRVPEGGPSSSENRVTDENSGPMTRLRAKRLREALTGLILTRRGKTEQVIDDEARAIILLRVEYSGPSTQNADV